jgi:multidrug efflux system membrane fusion protein
MHPGPPARYVHLRPVSAEKEWHVKKLLKWTLALAFLAGVVGVVAYANLVETPLKQFGRRGGAGMMRSDPIPVLAATAKRADVPVYFQGVGTAKARNTVIVRPQVDGRILSLNFKEGQEVKRGDVLVKIDPATYQAQLDQAQAKKALDLVQLENAKRDLERYSALGSNIIAGKTIDTQRALVGQLEAQIKADEAAIANARTFLDYTTIVSPINGRIGIRMVDEGNLVRASDAGIVMIAEIRPISVLFTLPQQQLGAVNKALARGPVPVEALDTDGKVPLDRGLLEVVDNQVDQTTGTVRMKADFPNADMQLWPGQFVNVRVLIDTLEQMVVIPTPAVQRGPSGPFAYVIGADDKVAIRPLTIRLQDDTLASITTGIEPSERVVTTGFARLKDGSAVAVDDSERIAESRPPPAPVNARTACADDVQKLCSGVERNRDAIRSCLRANTAQLSEGCKAATEKARSSRAQDANARKEKPGAQQ